MEMFWIVAEIILFTLPNWIELLPIILIAIGVVIVLFVGIELGLMGLAIMFVAYFYFTWSNPSPEQVKTNIPQKEVTSTQKNNDIDTSSEFTIDNQINSDPNIKNVNELLDYPKYLKPGDKEKLEKIREDRIKKIMQERGETIIQEYNKNNPQPAPINSIKQEEKINKNVIVENKNTNLKENGQTQPKNSFIDTLK